jgi:putative lipoprotein
MQLKFSVAGIVALLLFSVPPARSQEVLISGTLTYRQRIALPSDAVATVVLVDVSRADAPVTPLGSQTINNPGNPPIRFRIPYDKTRIDGKGEYALQARITVSGKVRFVTTRRYAVLTRNRPTDNVELLLDMVTEKNGASGSAKSYPAVSGTWRSGDASSTWTAYYEGKIPRYIVENRASGKATTFYTFMGKVLVSVRETRLDQEDARVDTRALYDTSGKAIFHERTVNGKRQMLTDAELARYRSHALTLLAEVAQRAKAEELKPLPLPTVVGEELQRESNNQVPVRPADLQGAGSGAVKPTLLFNGAEYTPGKQISETVKGNVTGYETREYLVRGTQNRTLIVSLQSANRDVYFTIDGQDLFSVDPPAKRKQLTLHPDRGYNIKVFLKGDTAERGGKADFVLMARVE